MHRPRKRFSQNFLIDEAVIAAIVEAVHPLQGERMVEIGPGLGALTLPLTRRVQPLHVIEIDRDIVARLRESYASERLVIHEGDALEFDFAALGPDLRVVGNLPYHISTPLLFHLGVSAASTRDIHAMLQSEVVERMVAAPGASDYGRLSVMLQYHFEIEKVLDVPAEAFRPAPKVESAVVRMIPRNASELLARDPKLFSATVAAAFSQRRKTLRNSLMGLLEVEGIVAAGVDPGARAETLAPARFAALASQWLARRGDAPRVIPAE